MLAPDPQSPVVPQTPVRTNLLQTLQILTQLAVHAVGQHLAVLAIHNVALTIEKPRGDFVLGRILNDSDDSLKFFRSNFTSSKSYQDPNQRCLAYVVLCALMLVEPYRLLRSTSAFLHTKLEYRRPTPFILVRAYMIFCLPSTLVLRRRRMNWKFDFSPETSAIHDVSYCQPNMTSGRS